MALSLRRGTVSAVLEEQEGLTRLEVDGKPCLAYGEVTGPVEEGDEVLVNVQARELGLGSGGFDVLYANLTRGLDLPPTDGAHVVKLPYTPLQFAVVHGEEVSGTPSALDGMSVVACSLHSQVAPVCAGLKGARVAYVQLAGGALPVALSDAVRALRQAGLIEVAIGVGPCFGGDVDTVNSYSGLSVARARGAEAVVCSIGPGIVGTGTEFGHGGMAAADAVTAARELGGRPVLAVRMSERDPRERHQGVSHHTRAVLSVLGGECEVAWPAGCPIEDPLATAATQVEVSDWRESCAGLPLSHMGRTADDDPWFFAAAFAAGVLARQHLS